MKFADVMSRLTERSFNLRGAELLLLKNRASPELRHFCIGVPDVADEVRAFVDVQSDLRGRGSGVNRENSEFKGLQKSPPRRWSSPCHPRSPPATESGWAPSLRRPRARTASRPGTSRISPEGCPTRCSGPPCSRRDLPLDVGCPSPAPRMPEVRNRGRAGRKSQRHQTRRLRPSR